MDEVLLPDKVFFKIGEVARLTGLKPHVLRYWETEFPAIRPGKSSAKQRLYQRRDIEAVLLIKKLLYEERFTIDGARTRLRELRGQVEADQPSFSATPLGEAGLGRVLIRNELLALRQEILEALKVIENGA